MGILVLPAVLVPDDLGVPAVLPEQEVNESDAREGLADFWNVLSSVSSGCSLSISLVMYLQIWTIDEKLLSLAIPESDRIFSATSRKERCHRKASS